SEIEDGNKRDIMVDHIADARKLGVEVLAPGVNCSESNFSVADGKIVFGLAAIKGCGRGATDAIVAARQEGGPFKDLFDFCVRVDPRRVNRAPGERLIKAAALDCFGAPGAKLMALLPRALKAASERQNDRRVGQLALFESAGDVGGPAANPAAGLPEVEPWQE